MSFLAYRIIFCINKFCIIFLQGLRFCISRKMSEENFTLYVGRIHPKVTEEILYELFLQVGPLLKVTLVKNRETATHKGFAFVNFKHKASLDYAIAVLSGERLYGQELIIKHKNKPNNNDTVDSNSTNVNDSTNKNLITIDTSVNDQHNKSAPQNQGQFSFDSVSKMIEMQRMASKNFDNSNSSFNNPQTGSFTQFNNSVNEMSDAKLVMASAYHNQPPLPPVPPVPAFEERPPLPPTPLSPPKLLSMQDSSTPNHYMNLNEHSISQSSVRQDYSHNSENSYHSSYSRNSPANYQSDSRMHKSYRNESRYTPYKNSNHCSNGSYHRSSDYARNDIRNYTPGGGDSRNRRNGGHLPGPYESRGNRRY